MNTQIPKAEIFSQGEEVVTGQIADTNASWLSQELIALGFDVNRHTAVGDRLESLVALLREIAARADCCLCTGGLGPTLDDLTAEAVARAFEVELGLDEIALENIRSFYTRMGQPMPAVNRKQALLPRGALRLDNRWGTAPGFALGQGRCRFFFMPGVPFEMRQMFRHRVAPELARNFQLQPRRLVTLRTVGIGESALQQRLAAIALPRGVSLGFRAASPEVQVKLLFPAGFAGTALSATLQMAAAAIGEAVFSVEGMGEPGGDLPEVVGRFLNQRRVTLALAETASGGLLASQCAGQPWFLEGAVFPDNDRLCQKFGLHAPAPGDQPSLASITAEAAERMRRQAGADYGLAQLGFPSPETSEVCFALATPSGTFHSIRRVRADHERKQAVCAALALDLLRRHLLGLPGKDDQQLAN